MENKITNFKTMEVSGVTKKEALANVPFNVRHEATNKYKKWRDAQEGMITDAMVKQFLADYLTDAKALPGDAYYITLQSAVKDTRKRPYKITNIKRSGSFKPQRVYRWVDLETGAIVCEVKTNKSDAFKALAKQYTDNNYTGKAKLIDEYVNKDGERVLATAEYTPSTGSRKGVYLVFGIEA